jgi:hypothetical protein
MIKGMDLMTSIGITVDCEKRCIRWGGTEIPLKTRNTLNNDEILHMLYHAANLLDYSHSSDGSCAHGCTDKSKHPESHPTKQCARASVLCLKTEPKY